VPPVVKIVDVPCDHGTPDAELPRVIYIAAEEEDCTSALKTEVADLQLLVDKLTVLLTLKGVQIGTGEECTVPGIPGDNKGGNGNTPGDKKGDTPGDNKGGNGNNPGDKKGDTPGDKKGDTPGDNKGGNGNNPGDKKGDTPGDKGGNGKNPTTRLTTTGSSAAVNTMLTVGLVIGAAVGAGVAAVAIGLFASAAAASAPAVASGAPMAAAAVNPLYTPLTQGGVNAMHA